MEAHGGRIHAESDGPGLGARFAFTLPAASDTEPAPRTIRAQEGGPSEGTALALMAEHGPRLALLDLMLQDHDGVELMGDILAVSRIPVIFLSAYGRDEVVARVLEEGADDYIVKPFSPTELVAGVRAVLRRSGEQERPARSEPLAVGDLRIDYVGRRVTVSKNPVELTPTEFDLLAALAAEAGRVVSHERLLRRVWNPGKPGNLRVLRTPPDETAPQAGRGRRQPEVHLRRAQGWIQDGEGGGERAMKSGEP